VVVVVVVNWNNYIPRYAFKQIGDANIKIRIKQS
jgi:hypothetical protein